MMRRQFIYVVILLGVALIFVSISSAAYVLKKGGKTYIKDQKGERWDVTQTKILGFKPELFQYGIGKNAFTPLDDSYLSDGSSSNFQNPRVIGIADGTEAQAYSVPKLRYHEIANTQINDKKIMVGY
ncbi:MAG: DUF3179 domain-containing protein [Deltaproteobacteria bacterium]|nr:DUF3179 domain-containing protein [Deltaproteobacteria bacterium]MBW2563028.1 DUF3179 domain-containing protein [Deltaproteobacteria bacterium]